MEGSGRGGRGIGSCHGGCKGKPLGGWRRAAGLVLALALLPATPGLAHEREHGRQHEDDRDRDRGHEHEHDSGPRCRFGPGALPADTLSRRTPHGDRIPIDHILVLMQENRSFDHYLGQLFRQGQRDAEPEPRGASNPDPLAPGRIRAFHQERICEVADLAHSWNAVHREWNRGRMDGFTAANVDPADPHGSRAMGFYDEHDLPFYYALYARFAMGDRYFSSVLSSTYPNRFFLLAATAFGHVRNDVSLSGNDFSQRTIFNVLDEAGVSWKVYFSQVPFALLFGYVRNQRLENLVPIAQFYADAQSGDLPDVAFIDPQFLGGPNEENDEHPPANPQVGEAFVAGVVNALFESPAWPSSALFVTYDEHGGYYDHVPPPEACVPDDIAPLLQTGDVPGQFDRYGIRVPFVAVSPYAREHFVSHRVYDHTSILRFIETRFDLPALTRRDANADPMLELFDFDRPPFLVPPSLPAAHVDPVRAAQCTAASSGELF
jgi:phospholipase C